MTLQRNREYLVKDIKLAGETFGVFFHPKGLPIYSASRSFIFTAVFQTLPFIPSDDIASWKEMKIVGNIPQETKIWLYVKSSDTETGLLTEQWSGPYMNATEWEDISSEKKKYICVRILISSYSETLDSVQSPMVDKLTIKAVTMGVEGKLFTKTFDLGFIPKHIVLTYNGTESDSSLLRFALAGKETIKEEDFQQIEPNKIVKIDKIPELANKMKLMVQATGTNGTPFNLDCFAVIVGGDGKKELNQP